MATSRLPGDGELRVGPVIVPAGRLLPTEAPEPAVWATDQPVPQPGLLWSQLSRLLPQTRLVPILPASLRGAPGRPWDSGEHGGPRDITGIDRLDAADVLAREWGSYPPEQRDEDLAEELAPFGWQFPGLAPPQQAPLGETELQQALGSLPPARIGLVPATRPADVLPTLGLPSTDEFPDTRPLAAVLRSWEDRFGARLLEVGFADIMLLVERPPRDLASARRIAAEHYAFCDECGGVGLSTISAIAAALVNAPFWSFWWD